MKLIFSLIFFTHSISVALNLCALTLANVERDYEKLTSLRNEVKTGLQEKTHSPKPVAAREITAIEALSRTGEQGAINKGIFRVIIDGKLYVLKIRTSKEKFQESNLIHEVLGQMGLAPQLKGVLNEQEMKTLGNKFPELFVQDKTTGLVMEEVVNAWNPKNTTLAKAETPKWVKNLDPREIRLQLSHLKRVTMALGINPSDLQVFINPQGKVFLGDLDFYTIKEDPNSEPYLDLMDYTFNELASDIEIYIKRGRP